VVGADGLLVEVHPQPDKAASDGDQSLTFEQFAAMMGDLDPYLSLRLDASRICAAGGFA
jgi:3-deoxy-7-phosphoheptulonate synthase